MGKWDYDEGNPDFDVVDDKTTAYVKRNFAVYGKKLSELPRLAKALEEMFDGLVHTELVDGVLDVHREGPRSKPKFTVELTVSGSRKITEEEEEQRQREEEGQLSRDDESDLKRLREIKRRSPHLFDQL